MTEIHEGGCLCGEVRFRVEGEPARASVCHCRYCQLRTGSAFGLGVYFETEKVTRLSGQTQSYQFTTESGNIWEIERCANCGTSMFWVIHSGLLSKFTGTSAGCYDPPTFWFQTEREVFTRSGAEFVTIDCPESFVTHPQYSPETNDVPRLTGGE